MDDSYSLHTLRRQDVVKDNILIQQSRHQFSLQQQKILLFLVSQLDSQNQKSFTEQTFDIADFCRACDINYSGKNYRDLKAAVLGIRNKGFWVKNGDNEIIMSWISRATISPKSGKITITLDEMMKPFLLELSANFTKYSLIYTLTMRSKYAVRLYELMKSYERITPQPVNFSIDRLKTLIGAEYDVWGELDRRAIKVAVMEINTVSDITVRYKGRRKGRSFDSVDFWIERKKGFENEKATQKAIYNRLTGKRDRHQPQQMAGQLTLDGGEVDG